MTDCAPFRNLKEKRYFPLYLIKNVLRRMDEGLSLIGSGNGGKCRFRWADRIGRGLIDRQVFLEVTGLTEKELNQAEKLGILISFYDRHGQTAL